MHHRIAIIAVALALPSVGLAQDSDADGVVDTSDAEPCDPTIAAWAYSPGLGVYGMIIFEDLWPGRGDFDFNDLVLAQNTSLGLDANGDLTRVQLELDVLAVGATFDNGLAFQLPVPQGSVASATVQVDGGAPTNITTWSSESQATLTLAQSARQLFGGVGFVNTDPALPTVTPVHLSIDVVLSSGQAIDPAEAPFDVFLFDASRGVEVHRPEHGGTSRLDGTLVGTADDGTSASRAFVTRNGIPFALVLPQEAAYPPEGQAIELLYPNIVTFGASQGNSAQDFYQYPTVGQSFPLVPTTTLPAVLADRTCISVNPPVDGACGLADGTALAWAPRGAALCSVGAATAVVSNMAGWAWSCPGQNGGATASCASPLLTSGGPALCETQLANVVEMRLEANPDATAFPSNKVTVDGRGTATHSLPDSIASVSLVTSPLVLDFQTYATVLSVAPSAYARVNYGICDYHPQSGLYVRASGQPVVRMHYDLVGAIHAPQPIQHITTEQAVASGALFLWSPYGPPSGTVQGDVRIFAHGTTGDSFSSSGIFANAGGLGGTPLYSYAYAYSNTFDMTPSTFSNNYVSVTISGEGSTLWAIASTVATLTATFSVPTSPGPCDQVMVAPDGTFLSARGSLATGCLGALP